MSLTYACACVQTELQERPVTAIEATRGRLQLVPEVRQDDEVKEEEGKDALCELCHWHFALRLPPPPTGGSTGHRHDNVVGADTVPGMGGGTRGDDSDAAAAGRNVVARPGVHSGHTVSADADGVTVPYDVTGARHRRSLDNTAASGGWVDQLYASSPGRPVYRQVGQLMWSRPELAGDGKLLFSYM